jgi:hypothetical protein
LAAIRTRATLPVFLIALLMQIFAPASAGMAMARALQADPLGMAPICGSGPIAGNRRETPDAPARHDDCCQLCHFAQAGAPLPTPQPARLDPPEPLTSHARWNVAVARGSWGERYYHAPARAPPIEN